MKSTLLIATISLFTGLLFTSCKSVAHIEKDETVNFSNYKTFAWIETSESKEEKPKNVSDITERHMKAAIKAELEKEGWQEAKKDPDILLSYDVLIENNLKEQNNPVYSQPYSRWFYSPYTRRWVRVFYPSQYVGSNNNAYHVKEGTITITMIDTDTDKTIWQGWTTETVKSKNLSTKEIQSSIKSIFRKFDVAKR